MSFFVSKMADKMKLPLRNCIHIELSTLKQNHKTLDHIIHNCFQFLEQNILLKFQIGIFRVHVYFPVFDNELWEIFVFAYVDMTFRIIMSAMSNS